MDSRDKIPVVDGSSVGATDVAAIVDGSIVGVVVGAGL